MNFLIVLVAIFMFVLMGYMAAGLVVFSAVWIGANRVERWKQPEEHGIKQQVNEFGLILKFAFLWPWLVANITQELTEWTVNIERAQSCSQRTGSKDASSGNRDRESPN